MELKFDCMFYLTFVNKYYLLLPPFVAYLKGMYMARGLGFTMLFK